MSFLKKSLEKRIHELRHSIKAQTTELAAYEQVLALESGKPLPGLAPAPAAVAAVVKKHSASQGVPAKAATSKLAKKATPASSSTAPITVNFNGSRSDFVASVLQQRGAAGVSPAEISAAFAAHKIEVGKNLVYNVLSLMFKQKRVRKSGGKYYLLSSAKAVPAKRRISEEGMRRIIAATKKRWAAARK
jgi:hypothetical protein